MLADFNMDANTDTDTATTTARTVENGDDHFETYTDISTHSDTDTDINTNTQTTTATTTAKRSPVLILAHLILTLVFGTHSIQVGYKFSLLRRGCIVYLENEVLVFSVLIGTRSLAYKCLNMSTVASYVHNGEIADSVLEAR